MPIHQFLGIYFDQFWISDTCRYESKPGTDEFRVDMEQLQLHTMRKAMAISKTANIHGFILMDNGRH